MTSRLPSLPAVPAGLELRLMHVQPDPVARERTLDVARMLGDREPASLARTERKKLEVLLGLSEASLLSCLAALATAGLNLKPEPPEPATSRGDRRRGEHDDQRATHDRQMRRLRVRQHRKLLRLTGKLPRALALRFPTTANTHLRGIRAGEDIYGPLECNFSPRDGHLGFIAIACARWHGDSAPSETFADIALGELAFLLRGAIRRNEFVGGRDIAWVLRLAHELSLLRVKATVDRNGLPLPDDRQIPSSPITAITVKLANGDFVPVKAFLEDVDAHEEKISTRTVIRVGLAEWVRRELAHPTRRPTFINFDVWCCLRPLSRRMYAWLQARTLDERTGMVEVYFAEPLRFTLGLTAKRQDRVEKTCVHALNQIHAVDERYRNGWRPAQPRPYTKLRQYGVRVREGQASKLRSDWDRKRKAFTRRHLALRAEVGLPEQERLALRELPSEEQLIARLKIRELLRAQFSPGNDPGSDGGTPPPRGP